MLKQFCFFESSLNGKSDPYVIVKIDNKQVHKSKTITANLNPKWNETFKLTVRPQDIVTFVVMDKDVISGDGTLGFFLHAQYIANIMF